MTLISLYSSCSVNRLADAAQLLLLLLLFKHSVKSLDVQEKRLAISP